eukprot:5136427-Amphidinium_carterae.3
MCSHDHVAHSKHFPKVSTCNSANFSRHKQLTEKLGRTITSQPAPRAPSTILTLTARRVAQPTLTHVLLGVQAPPEPTGVRVYPGPTKATLGAKQGAPRPQPSRPKVARLHWTD